MSAPPPAQNWLTTSGTKRNSGRDRGPVWKDTDRSARINQEQSTCQRVTDVKEAVRGPA